MRLYGRLAEELVARCPVDLDGRSVLDLGAGTGAVSAAASAASVTAVDNAIGMLLRERTTRPPAAVGDALALPFRCRAFDVVIAAFVLNHLDDPAPGMREAARVAREWVLAATYAAGDDHPVRHAVERALVDAGWSAPAWYREFKSRPSWGTVDAATGALRRAGLSPTSVELVRVAFPDLGPRELVSWRLGMAQCAAFVATHDGQAIEARALELLGDAEPVVRSMIVVTARAS